MGWQTRAGGKLAFEVASVKLSKGAVVPSNVPLNPWDESGETQGSFRADATLSTYVQFAYKLWPSEVQSREFSRKVRTLSGNYQLLQLAPWILGNGNPIRFEYISHKLLRLAVPFALLATLVTSALIPQTLYRVFLIAQLSFYALSLLGLSHVKIGLLRRLGDAALTFVMLNTAAAVAFANFVTGRKVAWTR